MTRKEFIALLGLPVLIRIFREPVTLEQRQLNWISGKRTWHVDPRRWPKSRKKKRGYLRKQKAFDKI